MERLSAYNKHEGDGNEYKVHIFNKDPSYENGERKTFRYLITFYEPVIAIYFCNYLLTEKQQKV